MQAGEGSGELPVGGLNLKDEVHMVGKGIGRNLRGSQSRSGR